MSHCLLLPIVIPLVAAGLLTALPVRARALHRIVNIAATLLAALVAFWLLVRAGDGVIDTYSFGNWPAPFGIVLQFDRLSAVMLALTALLACASLPGAERADAKRGRYFRPLFQFQLMGLNGAFLAGDLFNLFVFFELLLIASYALLLHGGGQRRVRYGLHYLLMNLTGSSFFLIALGVLYGLTGTLNMADMGVRLAQLDAGSAPLAAFAGSMLMLVFGLKAAVFPMSFWLPQTYRSAVGSVAALFAIMTKVGVYAILRCDALVFGGAGGVLGTFMHNWLWWLAIATIVFGALGALAVSSLKTTTGYLVLVSVGLLLAAVSLQDPSAWSAALYYLVSTTLCSGALFLLGDVLEPEQTTPDVDELGREPKAAAPREIAAATTERTASPRPWPARTLGLLYLTGAVGAAGLPPLSGFLGKAMVLAAVPSQEAIVLWPAVLVSSLVLIIALSRTGTRLLWAVPASQGFAQTPPLLRRGDRAKLAGCALLLACSVAATLGAGPLKRYLDASAAQLAERAAYVHAVLPAAR